MRKERLCDSGPQPAAGRMGTFAFAHPDSARQPMLVHARCSPRRVQVITTDCGPRATTTAQAGGYSMRPSKDAKGLFNVPSQCVICQAQRATLTVGEEKYR